MNKYKKSNLIQQDYYDFLLLLYFGRNKDYLENCIDRVYRDFNRTVHGFLNFENRDNILKESKLSLKEALADIKTNGFITSQICFDTWHKDTCYKLLDIFNKY